ncbi:N-acetylmuramoyl-L-alanine amidase [Bhargavaea cecembensis]|uniref:N-acetylmuramoyl-L-alanine amidase n=1 Tax=Bhargavaea cecembensis TaxID=394098 RepID=UPI00058C8F53|nr:N-acetylmuramoyl-L-alanine amidase [Bhargavaea cecembensis]
MNKRAIAIIIILLAAAIGTGGPLQDAPLAASESVTVSAPTLNIRSGPGLTHDITGSLKKGDRLTVTGKDGDWLQVETPSGTGWVASWLTNRPGGSKTGQTVISQVDRLNVRARPSTSAAVLSRMNQGDSAVSHGTSGEWTEITWNGEKGWVSSRYITESTANPEEKQTVDDGAEADGTRFTVSVGGLIVRKEPDQSSKDVGVIRKGETYPIKDRKHNWILLSVDGKDGWVYSFHGTVSGSTPGESGAGGNQSGGVAGNTVTIIYDGTNIRSEPSTSGKVVLRAAAGQAFGTLGQEDDWYRIRLDDGTEAYVASWVVSADSADAEKPEAAKTAKKVKRKPGTLKGLTIVVDAGHGGNDRGTTGIRGTDEKDLTLPTAELLAAKLGAAGAEVIMTRDTDRYISLRKRVSLSNQNGADAFISLHYDATNDHSVNGFTTYYLNSHQQNLAEAVHSGLSGEIDFRDRGVQEGNYLVLRENRQPAILIELGFLSNLSEERRVADPAFREKATDGIYRGIIDYFDDQIGK